jgi:hypothetical protein
VKSEQHDADNVTVELSGQVLHVRWAPGATVSERDAQTLMSRATELSSGRTLPMLVEMASMEWIDRRARDVFAAPWPLARMALVGASPVDEVIAGFYTARHTPTCPTRFFTSVDEAMTWLAEE